jgi:hypothetical protein
MSEAQKDSIVKIALAAMIGLIALLLLLGSVGVLDQSQSEGESSVQSTEEQKGDHERWFREVPPGQPYRDDGGYDTIAPAPESQHQYHYHYHYYPPSSQPGPTELEPGPPAQEPNPRGSKPHHRGGGSYWKEEDESPYQEDYESPHHHDSELWESESDTEYSP